VRRKHLCCGLDKIQTAVAFLYMRVKKPDKDVYKKLTRVMQYLQGTKELMLTIEPEDHPN